MTEENLSTRIEVGKLKELQGKLADAEKQVKVNREFLAHKLFEIAAAAKETAAQYFSDEHLKLLQDGKNFVVSFIVKYMEYRTKLEEYGIYPSNEPLAQEAERNYSETLMILENLKTRKKIK